MNVCPGNARRDAPCLDSPHPMRLSSAARAVATAYARSFNSSALTAAAMIGDMQVPGDGRTREVTVLPGHGCV